MILTLAATAPLFVPVLFPGPEWSSLTLIFPLAGIHYAFYMLAYIPGQTLVALGRSRDFAGFYALYSAVLLAGTLAGSGFLGVAAMPMAGILASLVNFLLWKRFRDACPSEDGPNVLMEQLLLLLASATGAWYLASGGYPMAALGLWAGSLCAWLAFFRKGRYNLSVFLSEMLRAGNRPASGPTPSSDPSDGP